MAAAPVVQITALHAEGTCAGVWRPGWGWSDRTCMELVVEVLWWETGHPLGD